jgi:hypothetical protein
MEQLRSTLLSMADEMRITSVELDGNDGLIVTFSDRTTGAYAVEELLGLRVMREPVEGLESQIVLLEPAR